MPPSSSNSATQYDQTQLGRPAYSQMNGPVLPSTAPAHTMYESLLIVLTYWEADHLPYEWSNALEHCAVAQNVSDVILSSYILAGWPSSKWGIKCFHSSYICIYRVRNEGTAHSARCLLRRVSTARRWPGQPNATS